jgi:DNA primase
VLLTRPERVIITEGVTDCISLMEHGFPVVSPVTVQTREADWERLLPKLTGVKTVFICQDNEVSSAGLNGALRTARALAARGILTRVAVLPLGEKQQQARQELRDSFGVDAAIGPREMAKRLEGRTAEDIERAEALLADAKIDVNEFFAAGTSAADFEAILTAAETPLEMAIAKLDAGTPDEQMESLLEPILQEVGQMGPIERERHLRLIQARCGKSNQPHFSQFQRRRFSSRRPLIRPPQWWYRRVFDLQDSTALGSSFGATLPANGLRFYNSLA